MRKAAVRTALAALLGWSFTVTDADAQNLILNPGFEDSPPSSYGNNVGHSISPWTIGVGNDPNVVRVNGAPAPDLSGITYGPDFDAQNGGTGAGDGVFQHYLDVANGSNDFYQSFTVPACGTNPSDVDYTLSGYFSLRTAATGGGPETGTILLREGTGLAGAVVTGSTATATMPAISGRPDSWHFTSASVALTQGQTYSYVVSMGNNVNFDEASLTFVPSSCPDVIDAVDDDYSGTPVDGLNGDTVGSVLDNDTVNSVAAASDGSDTTIAVSDDDGMTGVTIDDDGTINIPASTPAGTYDIVYDLCDEDDGTNCDSATATIVVETPTIDAVDDDYSGSPVDGLSGGTAGSVLDNDTLGGSAVATDGSETTITVTDDDGMTGVTIADDGTVTVPAGTPAGSYDITYQLCDQINPTNCDSATATVVVGIGSSFIPRIEQELLTILEDDLAATMGMQSEVMEGYAAGALERLKSRTGRECAAAASLEARAIRFDTDKSIIKPESDEVLDEIASILASCRGSAFEIAGHTDSDASDAYNVGLSQRRVEAVLHALMQRGVDTTGFEARGYGESRPVATNGSAAGKALNRRVDFNLIGDQADDLDRQCSESGGSLPGFTLNADDSGVSATGNLDSESYDCHADRWTIVEGSLHYTETDRGLTQGALSLAFRRERFVDGDSVRGYFIGAYGSHSDIDTTASGTIDGVGLNAGIYGAERLRDNLFLDYHLGGATGIHEYDLAFDDALGTITATGNYQYFAGFAGAALSSEFDYRAYALSPRVGFDYAYSPGGSVDVEAALSGVSETGTLELDAVSGGRVFAEIRAERPFDGDRMTLALTPRMACYEELGGLDGDCGFGASFELGSAENSGAFQYSVEVTGERGSSYSSGSLRASLSRPIGAGSLSADATMDSQNSYKLGGRYEVNF